MFKEEIAMLGRAIVIAVNAFKEKKDKGGSHTYSTVST